MRYIANSMKKSGFSCIVAMQPMNNSPNMIAVNIVAKRL